MGLPLPPRPPGVRYALLIHDLFQITLKNYHANRLKALVYRVSDYLSIAYALRVADRVWTPFAVQRRRGCAAVSRVAGKVRVLPNQVDGFAGEPADLSARGLPPRYWLLVGTRELHACLVRQCLGRAPARRPACRRWCWSAASDHLPEEQRGARPARSAGSTTPNCALYRQAERLSSRPTRKASACAVVEAAERRHAGGGGQRHLAGRSHPAVSAALLAQRRRRLERLMLRLADAPREASAENSSPGPRFNTKPAGNGWPH